MSDPTALFSDDDARAFDKGQLADEAAFSAAAVTAKEAEIREWLHKVCGVAFIPTTVTDEYRSGSNTAYLTLAWPKVTSVTAISTRSDSTWTALTVAELADVQIDPDCDNRLYREGSYWPSGVRNIKATYVHGYSTVPALVKDAALRIAVTEMPTTSLALAANSYENEGEVVSFNMGDGFNENWHKLPEVRRVIRLYSQRIPGVA